MTSAQDKIITDALNTFGPDHQIDKCIEECGELIAALTRYRDGRATVTEVVDELADVGVMRLQMVKVFGPAAVDRRTAEKMERLEAMIAERKGECSNG
mgnify:CR=1 FL=1